MLRGRIAEVAAVSGVATIVTLALAAPVLRAPSERMFGMELVGRHHDPFTVMAQFEHPIRLGVYSQPVTDISGALLARLSGGVAAFNWLVLLSFPLSAAAAYLLARHLSLSPAGAAVAAMAYAFSPFHLAHAAYHPHIAQTQWMPVYLLALWRCLDTPSPWAVAFLGAATIAVTLSNFYGGLIAAVVTPFAVAAYWLVTRHTGTRSRRGLGLTLGMLAVIAASGIAYAHYAAGAAADRAAFAFPRADLFRYSAKWWAYLLPPVAHPLAGDAAHRLWTAAGVREGLLEQQVSLGLGIVALALIAVVRWLVRDRQPASLARVPVLVIVAMAALVCSLSPERTIGTFTFVRPSALLYDLVPMFRSYARFGVVVQLMAALLAGVGVDWLRRTGTTWSRVVCVALLVLAAAEYTVLPSALWRDVLPTAAHRWVVRQPGDLRVLDCTPFDPESESVPWLTGDRVRLLGGSIEDCAEPHLAQKLAADGYTHLLVRPHTADGRRFTDQPTPEGLRAAARFSDGQVFAVTSKVPAIYTATLTGFSPREYDSGRTWRWMGSDAAWTIVNTSTQTLGATLEIELSAFHGTRHLEVRLDGHPVQTVVVEPSRRMYDIGALSVLPGGHELLFHPGEAPTVANDVIDNGDGRALSFEIGSWNWTVRGAQR
jgi:hypothetical protein